jgi:hypothetical protein
MKIIEAKTPDVEIAPGDLVNLKGKYYRVAPADAPCVCRAQESPCSNGAYCAGYGKHGICRSLPDCFTDGIVFIRLSGQAQKKIERKIIINQ